MVAPEAGFVGLEETARDKEAIQDIYREKGYYRATVTDTVVMEPKSKEQTLVYKMHEGAKVKVRTARATQEAEASDDAHRFLRSAGSLTSLRRPRPALPAWS